MAERGPLRLAEIAWRTVATGDNIARMDHLQLQGYTPGGTAAKFLIEESEEVIPLPEIRRLDDLSPGDYALVAARIQLLSGYIGTSVGIAVNEEQLRTGIRPSSLLELYPERMRRITELVHRDSLARGEGGVFPDISAEQEDVEWLAVVRVGRNPLQYVDNRINNWTQVYQAGRISSITLNGARQGRARYHTLFDAIRQPLPPTS